MALRGPFLLSVVAPTGSGKTHNVAAFISKIKSGEFPLGHRFDTKEHVHTDPFHFTRVYYIGQRVDDSMDITHNANVLKILDGGRMAGVGVSIDKLKADNMLGGSKDYAGVGAMVKPSTLLGNYLKEIVKKEKGNHPLIVVDDCSSYLDGMTPQTCEDIKNVFNVHSHHGGVSIVFIYQKNPEDRMGKALHSASHYTMFPIPPSEYSGQSTGVSVNDFRTIAHATQGFSKVLLAKFQDMIAKDKPNFILYNRVALISDHDIGKEPETKEVGQEDKPEEPNKKPK